MIPQNAQQPPRGQLPVVLRILSALILSLPGLAGVVVLAAMTGIWLANGFRYPEAEAPWMLIYIIPAVVAIQVSVLTVGIILRFARWRHARTASLAIGVASVASIVIGYLLLLACITPDDTQTPMIGLLVTIAGLVLVAVPPLLYWRSGRTPG